MAMYLVRLRTHTGTAAAHYVDADEHRLGDDGVHRLYDEGRLVWQGPKAGVLGVRAFDDRQAAIDWHRAHRHELADAEQAYRHEASTGKGASPFIGGVQIKIGER